MTAIVGALNKKGVAVAADSAMTIGIGKIINTAQKIFELESQKGIGVAICGSLNYMGTPLNVLISLFNKYCLEKKLFFENISACKKSFKEFLEHEKFTEEYYPFIKREFAVFLENIITKESSEIVDQILNNGVLYSQAHEELKTAPFITEFAKIVRGFLEEEAPSQSEESVDPNENNNTGTDPNTEIDTINYSALEFSYICSFLAYRGDTGITFFGYGTKSIFPEIAHSNLHFKIEGWLLFEDDPNSSYQVNYANLGNLIPFAQADVINTLVTGIADDLEEPFINFITNQILHLSPNKDPQQIAELKTQLFHKLNNDLTQIKNHNTYRVSMTVSYLDIDDLAEHVESLIYVTYLSRRIKSREEGVGGAVDVAVVTLEDGFQWVKYKKYTN